MRRLTDPDTLRPSLFLRLFFTLSGVALMVFAFVPFEDEPGYWTGWYWSEWGLRLLLLVMGLGMLIAFHRPYVRLEEDTLIAQGILFSRIKPIASVTAITPGQYGLWIEYDDGDSFEVTFVGEKGLLSELIGRRTAGDSLADRILAAAASARAR